MTTKRVTFEFVFEYDTEQFPDKTDDEFEKMAFSTLEDNIYDLAHGEVKTIEE